MQSSAPVEPLFLEEDSFSWLCDILADINLTKAFIAKTQ
jgi:hypothetical protein